MFLFTSLEGRGGGSPPPPPYPGTTVAIDFVNGIYFVNGVAYSAADITDHPEWITSNGLEILYSHETTEGSGVGYIIGPALAVFAADVIGTVLIEYYNTDMSGETQICWMLDAPLSSGNKFLFFDSSTNGGGTDSDFFGETTSGTNPDQRFADSSFSDGTVPGRQRVAITRASHADFAISYNGHPVVYDQHPASIDQGAIPVSYIAFGSDPGSFLYNELYVRKFLYYPTPVADADLPALTSL